MTNALASAFRQRLRRRPPNGIVDTILNTINITNLDIDADFGEGGQDEFGAVGCRRCARLGGPTVAAVDSIVAAGTAAAGSMTPGNGGTGWDGCYPKHCDPFAGSKLGATPTTSFSFPSYACGYQNRACFCIL